MNWPTTSMPPDTQPRAGPDVEAIAKHLALLAQAGLVRAEPGERRRVRYRLRSAPMQVAQHSAPGGASDYNGPRPTYQLTSLAVLVIPRAPVAF